MQTPLMAQYFKIKKEYPDTILLFRVGDFFETFEEDAKLASKTLGITLTKRANGAAGEVPLAGFPHHALDAYLPKLVRAGFRVAVCDQVENPKFAKGIVKREVTEVVTPGVAFSDKLLDHKKNNYLLSFFINESIVGISFCDISTGEFFVFESSSENLLDQLEAISPAEILFQKKNKELFESGKKKFLNTIKQTKVDDWIFNFDYGRDLLLAQFKTVNLKGFGVDHLACGIAAAGAIMHYLNETQKANLSHLTQISLYNPTDYMILDSSTKRNLEITFTLQGGTTDGTLISVLDKTETPMGARLLKKWISAPLKRLEPILQRQSAVNEFFLNKVLRRNLTDELKEIGDLERLISKICTGRANPREVTQLKFSLKKLPAVKQLLSKTETRTLTHLHDKISLLDNLTQKIEEAIVDAPPLNIADGGVIRPGFSPELDELRDISINGKDWIANLQKLERERSGISSLKVSYNRVFGYYIEISNANKEKVPTDYIRKQTLVNSERFITPELKEYEEKVLHAEEKIYELESQLFNEIRLMISTETNVIQNNARMIAMLDVFLSLAACAEEYAYVKPEMDESNILEIVEGRHPVIERILPPGEKFTANSCSLNNDESQIIILTGPNMAGKSVYLRQTGLIVLLGQIGSFVPAKSAHIGIIDRIFTRVGASDNITAGESTFLVEMQEAANIINNATEKSLALLDEIGRGTSTFDGISIAWAITEFIHENPNIQAKTLFATHYHELNEMSELFPRIKNYKVEVREYDDKVIFLHRVSAGRADHSYGIQVAQMAGLPTYITNRAKEILENLESKELTPHELKKEKLKKLGKNLPEQFSLFEFKDDEIRTAIKDIEINALTPVEALNKLNELQKKASQ